jgi:hypothetical protein
MGPQLGRRVFVHRDQRRPSSLHKVAQREDAQRAEGLGCSEEESIMRILVGARKDRFL